MDTHTVQRSRVVRVFLSSTFRDMQAERDELAKVIFPELRSFCHGREVEFVEVDLRWGVTEEQSQRGETLRLCLEEINRCRPFFIGLLGERYGWVPGAFQADVREDFDWLERAEGRSVTELEILHGVLNNPQMAGRALFYFRDPAYAATRGHGFTNESHSAAQKLADLKQRIRASGIPVVENYPDPKNVARLIGQDLQRIIEVEYPLQEKIASLDREAAEHEAFARIRERAYVGREEYFECLEQFTTGVSSSKSASSTLVVLGESGSGKSALLSNWAKRHRADHPNDFLLLHFIGSTPASADYVSLLRRVMGELKRRFDLKDDLPDQPAMLRKAFPNWLAMAAHQLSHPDSPPSQPEKRSTSRGSVKAWFKKPTEKGASTQARIILVMDGLNQLEDQDNAPDLVWLPENFPNQVRVIVSTLPGRSLDALKRRPHNQLQVSPLTTQERQQLAEAYLALYRKRLDRQRLEHIANTQACANPLYLRVLLEELRLFGLHEKLGERIDHYLKAQTVPELYQKVLERLEQDYDPAQRGVWKPPQARTGGMVGDALALIWAARRGLTEGELLDLLGGPPRAAWSPLFLALQETLIERQGVLNFSHDYLRQAVETRYLPGKDGKRAIRLRLRLAEYFDRRLKSSKRTALDGRVLEELPWLWMMAGEWLHLYNLLSDLDTMEALWRKDWLEAQTSWAAVEAHSQLRKTTAYKKVLKSPGEYPTVVIWLADLLRSSGNSAEALGLDSFLLEEYRESSDQTDYAGLVCRQAVDLLSGGDLNEAMVLFKKAEDIYRQLGDMNSLSLSLSGQAFILCDLGDYNRAMELYKEVERISHQLGDMNSLSISLSGQARVLSRRGELDKAMVLHEETERICRQSGFLDALGQVLGEKAITIAARGNLDEAIALHKEEELIFRQLGRLESVAFSLGNQANILYERGDLERALALSKEQESLGRRTNNLRVLQSSLSHQGRILYKRGDLNAALGLFQESARICRQLGMQVDLQNSLFDQASIHSERSDLEKALALLKEQERICRDLNLSTDLARSLLGQVRILKKMGKTAESLALAKEAMTLGQRLGDRNFLKEIKKVIFQ